MKNGLFKLVPFDLIKGAFVSVFVAILTYVQQLLSDGGQVSIKVILTTSITSLIGYMIKQLMTDNNGVILSMVGGRKKRKKKPTGFPQNNIFEFDENLFTTSSVVTYTSDVVFDELSVTVLSVSDSPNSQSVTFNEPIQYSDFETLLFEVEVV